MGAAAVISVMLVVVYTVHIKKGVFGRNGYEYNFVPSAVALTLAFAGPGLLSVDAPLGCKRSGPLWGVAALGLGVLGAMVTLFPRKTAPTV